MYLSRVKIHNFRLLRDFTLTLNPNLNLIVGENNSGKTALIDAIRYALGTNSLEWIRIQNGDFHDGQTEFTIQLKFEDISVRQGRVFVEHLTHEQVPNNGGRRSVLYVNLRAELTDQLARGNQVIHTELRSGENADGPSIEREVRSYLAATYLKPLRDAEAELTAGRGSRLSQVLMSAAKFRDQAHVNDLIQTVITANQQILTNPGISESRQQISKQLDQLNFKTQPCNPSIEILGGTEFSQLSETDKKQLFRGILEKLQLLIDENDRHQGLGYNNLLFMATELLLLEQEQDDFPLLMIEEPEAHLHPQLQMKLLKAIREDFGGEGEPVLQSILSTHSPNLASKAPLENIIMMASGKAFPLCAGKTELDPDDYVFLEKFLDVTKSNLFFCKGAIVVEGDGESILLPTIADLLGLSLEQYGISIINVGGTSAARYAKVFRRKGLDDTEHKQEWIPTKVMCLRDLDLWPDRAEKRDDDDAIGFKRRLQPNAQGKGGNHSNWHSNHNAKSIAAHITRLKNISGQNVRVEVSDEWTFEYSLAKKGLAKEIYEAVHGSTDGFTALSNDEEERAIQIYKLIEAKGGGKTQTAYAICRILTENYSATLELAVSSETDESAVARRQRNDVVMATKRAELRGKLPSYILRALDYMIQTENDAQNTVAVSD